MANDRGATVLLVDDNDMVRDLITRVLDSEGYELIVARGGEEALALARGNQRPIDLVISDVDMPDMDGNELAARLRRERPAMPVIFMSGYTDVADPSIASPVQFMRKPFSTGQLREMVRRALRGRTGSDPDAESPA